MLGMRWLGAVVWVAGSAFAQQEPWAWRDVTASPEACRTVLATVQAKGGALEVKQTDSNNGFVFPKDVRPFRTGVVEADLLLQKRLVGDGWSLAGVTLCRNEQNFWILALVEGPNGQHTVDFIESLAGVWQAQGEDRTALKREGNLSFEWKSGVPYRLRLALRDGRVWAEVAEPADGRVLAAASYAFGGAAAVRSGCPGLIVRAEQAECRNVRFGVSASPKLPAGVVAASGALGRAAMLDDDLPGHDRAANARLAAALEQAGLGVTRLTADQLLAPDALRGDVFDALVLPQCAAMPAASVVPLQQFAEEGGHLFFIGGPFLDRALWKIGGQWLDAQGLERVLQSVSPAHRPFVIGPDLAVPSWPHTTWPGRPPSSLRVVNEGPEQVACLRLDIPDLYNWDVWQTPELPGLFGEGDTLFTFQARGDERTRQLAVEVIERDGSRWIATAALTTEWRRIGLRLSDFLFWADASAAKGRGRPGDALNPRQAVRVCVGLSGSHTPSAGPGPHTVWLADIGTAHDPLAEADTEAVARDTSIETVFPRYKVFTLETPATVADVVGPGGQAGQPFLSGQRGLVCAIPRTEGQGFGRGPKWRFVPRAEARTDGARGGACEWLLLNVCPPLDGVVFAGFGYGDPAVWSSTQMAQRMAARVAGVVRGAMFEEAGSGQFAYWPGEAITVGARLRTFGKADAETNVELELLRHGKAIWSRREAGPKTSGVTNFVFRVPAFAKAETLTFRARLKKGGACVDQIEHELAVLEPAPADKSQFVAVKDGNFWVNGKAWYPVGVNFWPLYTSGMDASDYWPGWLRDAYYAPARVESDLVRLQEMGVNLVSVQSPPPAEYRNLLDFLRLCGRHDIRVNLFVGQASPLAFDEPALKAFFEASRLPGNPAVFAYDTIWEPGNYVFQDDRARQRWDAAWRAWIDERYGSLARAEKEWGVPVRRDAAGQAVSPEDKMLRDDGAWRTMTAAYRRFMDDLTSSLWGKANRRLRALDPNHLLSFRQGNTLPHDFALTGPVKHIDFICPEGYSIGNTDEGEDAIGFITRFVAHTTGGKPIVWSEFGSSVWNHARLAPDPESERWQGQYEERFYRTALAAGANGTVPWWWTGGYRVDEKSDFGIATADGGERPAARLIRAYGPLLKAPRTPPEPTVWFDFDRDAHAGGYWWTAFHEGAAAYRAAAQKGQLLGVRTAGTGTDSSNVPLVAVGGTTCDGSTPPKYLDAEFNALQVLDASGVWREAEDGAEIAVAAGRPVRARASLGNLQEAAWVSNVALVVRTREGKRLASVPLKTRVPCLADAEFGEFDFAAEIGTGVAVSVRLEAQTAKGCVPFGEARTFAVRAH